MFSEAFGNAVQLQRSGRFVDAERQCRLALSFEPRNPDAIYLLGLLLLQQRRNEEAIAQISLAIEIRPQAAEYHANLGHALRSLNRFDESAARYEHALSLKPDYTVAMVNLGSLRRQQGRFDDAVTLFQRALKIDPSILPGWMNLGNAYRDQSKLPEALAAYQRASELDRNSADIHFAIASILGQMHRPLDAKRAFDAALRINPNHLPSLINFGLMLRLQNDFDGAIKLFRQVIQIDPNNAEGHERLARVLFAACQFDEAMRHYDIAFKLSPTPYLKMTLATLIPPAYRSVEDVQWWRERLEREVDKLHVENFKLDITNQPPPTIFYLPYQGLPDREIAEKIAGLCATTPSPSTLGEGRGEGRISSDPSAKKEPLPSPLLAYKERERDRIRVAFLSSLFKDQTVGLWFQGLVAKISREKFEVIVISTAEYGDGIGTFIRKHADRYIVLPQSLPVAREIILKLNLDVLIHADIGMAPWTGALAHSRLAPVQCVMWGHPITSGISTIDYYISSELAEAEDAEQNYIEKLVRLANLPVYYFKPDAPKENVSRADFNLPSDANLYGCLQAQYKLHPSFDEALAGILRADSHGLLLLSRGGTAQAEHIITDRLRKNFPDILDRVRFMPTLSRDHFRGLTSLCDVLLAPFPFGAGDSSLEGFAMNLPIVTLPTPFMKGRLTHAMYRAMQIDDCVASDLNDYVRIAVQLGTDRAFNQSVREKIRAKSSVLYENEAGVRDLEKFLTEAAARKAADTSDTSS